MKIRIEHISEGEDEIVLKYREKTREIEELLSYLNHKSHALLCKKEGEEVKKGERVLELGGSSGKTA